MEPAHARRVCELISGIILTDGDLHPAENELLVRLLSRFGVSRSVETMISPAIRREEAVRAIKELPAEVREEALDGLIEAAIVDGKVVPDEQRYLDAVARAMGVAQDVLDDRVTQRLLDG